METKENKSFSEGQSEHLFVEKVLLVEGIVKLLSIINFIGDWKGGNEC